MQKNKAMSKENGMTVELDWNTITEQEITNIINSLIKRDCLLYTFIPFKNLVLNYRNIEAMECVIQSPQCKTCGKCCQNFHGSKKKNFIEIGEADIIRIKKIHPNFKYKHYTDFAEYKIYRIPLPCQFYKGRCTIYEHRPVMCRFYPLQTPETHLNKEKPKATLCAECPMAVFFIRKLYSFYRKTYQEAGKVTSQDINKFIHNLTN